MIDVSKDTRQDLGTEKWKHSGGKGTLEYAMGFGKTRTALKISHKVQQHNMYSNNGEVSIILVVPSAIGVKGWTEEIEKFSAKVKIEIFTADQIVKAKQHIGDCALLIIDEVHKFVSDKRKGIIDGTLITYKWILGLTGTFPSGKDRDFLNRYCPVVDTITQDEALRKGWTAKFIEYNIRVDLPYEDKYRYEEMSEPISETLDLFKNSHRLFPYQGDYLFRDDYDVIQACVYGKKLPTGYIKSGMIRESLAAKKGWSPVLDFSIKYNADRDEYWSPNSIKARCSRFVDFVRKRNLILVNNMSKLHVVVDIYKRFPVTTICFNESTIFADAIEQYINNLIKNGDLEAGYAVAYHSNIESRALVDENGEFIRYKTGKKKGQPKMFGKKRLRENALSGIRDEKFSFLCTAKALNESLDIPKLSQVITTAGTTNPLTYKQRGARGTRVDIYNPNKVTRIFNLYFDNFESVTGRKTRDGKPYIVRSRDKSKLIQRQRENNHFVRWIDHITDVS